MMDVKSEVKLSALHPKARPIFRAFIEESEREYNTIFRITYGLRTFDEQQAIYNQGRITPGPIVSYSPPGKSFHNHGLAIDIAELKEDKLNFNYRYENLLAIAKKYDIRWGGLFKVNVNGVMKDFPDRPHYQISFGLKISDLYQKYLNKDFIPGTKYVNI